MAEEKDQDLQLELQDAELKERPDYQDEILEIVGSSAGGLLQNELDDFHDFDLAHSLVDMDTVDKIHMFKHMDPEALADVFEYLDEQELSDNLSLLRLDQMVEVLNFMEPDKVAALVRPLKLPQRSLLLPQLNPALQESVDLILSYKEDQIGSKMTTNFIEIPRGISIGEAMKELKAQALNNDNIDNLYVTDQGQYYGTIELKDLIIARLGDDLEALISTSYPYLYGKESLDEALEELKDYNDGSVPILNDQKIIQGVITVQDLLEVMNEEMAEDYAMLAGLTEEEDMNETLTRSLKKRLPWLIALLLLGLLVSSVVSIFEGVVAALTIVMVFQSLILDMAGNVGTQSLAVTIRVLLDDSLDKKQQRKFILKEGRVGFTNGLIVGTITLIAITFYIFLTTKYGFFDSSAIAFCVSFALLVAMTVSAFSGTLIPISLKRFGVDPAVASGPLITTINDLLAIVIYYSLAGFFLIGLLHIRSI